MRRQGVNIDAVETAAHFDIGKNRAVNYHADSNGTQLLDESLAVPICAVRAGEGGLENWRRLKRIVIIENNSSVLNLKVRNA